MKEKQKFSLAVDIGGTKMDLAVIDKFGKTLSDIDKLSVPFDHGSASLEGIIDLLSEYVERARGFHGEFQGIGISSCGLVDLESGEVIVSPNQHWYGVPLRSAVQTRFKLPVYAATDTRLAVLGEAVWGAEHNQQNFAWVTLGTGFGGAFLLNGRLYGGERGFAGAFGHNTVDEITGFPCGCGRRGCLETFASGRTLARNGQAAVDMGHDTILKEIAKDESVTAKMVFEAEKDGDVIATHLVSQLVRYSGIGISQLVNILDLNLIIMGGGLTKAGLGFLNRIEEETKKHLFNAEVSAQLRIIKETLPNSAMFGAAANVFMHTGELQALW